MIQFSSRFLWFIYAITLLLMILVGICCYYAGYIASSKEFYSYYMADSFNDKISASLYTLYGDSELDDTTSTSSDESSLAESSESEAEPDADSDNDVSKDQEPLLEPVASNNQLEAAETSRYDAYLIGFGAKRSADRYVEKLKSEGILARVITRENINARGKKIIWYQVVLGPLPYNKLLEIVELLKYRDKLEGVVFVEHKS